MIKSMVDRIHVFLLAGKHHLYTFLLLKGLKLVQHCIREDSLQFWDLYLNGISALFMSDSGNVRIYILYVALVFCSSALEWCCVGIIT